MSPDYFVKGDPFNVPTSTAEAAMDSGGEVNWDDECRHIYSRAGPVTHVAGAELPYTAALTGARGLSVQRAFATMREAEAFIRRNTPVTAPALSTLYDRPASES